MVPNKPGTFDRNRELTTLEHNILDYERPDPERDKAHYREFLRVVQNVTEDLDSKVETAFSTNADVHFHTWTYESFAALVEYSRRSISPWREVWSQPAIDNEPFEFYFTLMG